MSQFRKPLWIAYLVATAAVIVLGFAFPYKGHFEVDSWPLFGTVFAVIVGIGALVVAAVVGYLLRREDDYYG